MGKNSATSGNPEKLANPEGIILTDSCIKRLKFICQEDANSYLRVMVKYSQFTGIQIHETLLGDQNKAQDINLKICLFMCSGALDMPI